MQAHLEVVLTIAKQAAHAVAAVHHKAERSRLAVVMKSSPGEIVPFLQAAGQRLHLP